MKSMIYIGSYSPKLWCLGYVLDINHSHFQKKICLTSDSLARIIIYYIECAVMKNFGFVHMAKKEQADDAIDNLNRTELGGQSLTVKYARQKNPMNNQNGLYF